MNHESSLFRSEEMTLCQLFLQSEAAYNCVAELGELGLAQFRDLNPDLNAFQRKFVNEVRRCDEMERKLRYLEKEIKKDGIPILDSGENTDTPQPREMANLETVFDKIETEFREVNKNAETLKQNFMELTELRHLLRKTQVFFDEEEMSFVTNAGGSYVIPVEEEQIGILSEDGTNSRNLPIINQLGFVAGVILRERLPPFELMLWRACRGNVFWRLADIETTLEDPATGDQVSKNVFVIFFQGDQLKTRVKKICEAFRATIYPCPETPSERREMSIGVMTRLEDLSTILAKTSDHRYRVLVAASKSIKSWFIKIRKIKAVYHTLNFFNLDVTQKCLIAECWIPILDIDLVHSALTRGTENSESTVPPILNRLVNNNSETPPTYNKLNKYTRGFQNLVDAFGIATYREVNPTPYTIITFPFLFAVMFGDAGHAFIMLLFAIWMIIMEKKFEGEKGDEIWEIFFSGRYIIFLMGCFSFYTGIIYNDVFSKSLNIFGSSWFTDKIEMKPDYLISESFSRMLDPKICYSQNPYPIGFDPVWQVAENKIVFLNAAKMKISIILGVVHMLFGIFLSLWNHIYFKRIADIWCEFAPRILFMFFLFVYLCVLMFYKWVWYGPNGGLDSGPNCAPSILISFINMVLFKGIEKQPAGCHYDEMFTGQDIFQKCIFILAILCIPWMLFAKPLVILYRHLNQRLPNEFTQSLLEYNVEIDEEEDNGHGHNNEQTTTIENHGHRHSHQGQEFDFSEIMILQGIHTIEYVLSSVSHTASYLRLWALSLAHAQLSDVLWSMVLRMGFEQESWIGGIIIYFMFSCWAFLTVGILVGIEGMSAFLHTLRLHWVESQSKFFSGEGYAFAPFCFKDMLNAVDKDE